MIEYIVNDLIEIWSPFRLFTSHFFLAAIGALFSGLITYLVLPKYWGYLVKDRGRAHAIGAKDSIGKPLGVGIIMTGVIILTIFIFCPMNSKVLLILPVIAVASIIGYIDDKTGGLSELTLGVSDLILAILTSLILFGFSNSQIWLPFTSRIFELSPWINLPMSIGIIWISINALNCNDGVDGLSGSLSVVSILSICIFFYFVSGNINQSEYLLIPYNPDAPTWAIFGIIVSGSIFSYLWYNMPPSQALIGDAGSRPLGLIIGILVCVSQNPVFILVFTLLILANGATGLFKLAVLRIFKFGILKSVRFPLHDHFRKNLNWSNTQVLGRFVQIHILLILILLTFLLKVR